MTCVISIDVKNSTVLCKQCKNYFPVLAFGVSVIYSWWYLVFYWVFFITRALFKSLPELNHLPVNFFTVGKYMYNVQYDTSTDWIEKQVWPHAILNKNERKKRWEIIYYDHQSFPKFSSTYINAQSWIDPKKLQWFHGNIFKHCLSQHLLIVVIMNGDREQLVPEWYLDYYVAAKDSLQY